MKQYFFKMCQILFNESPADWEESEAIMLTKNKYPKSGVSKRIFENKWLNEFKVWNYENSMPRVKEVLNSIK